QEKGFIKIKTNLQLWNDFYLKPTKHLGRNCGKRIMNSISQIFMKAELFICFIKTKLTKQLRCLRKYLWFKREIIIGKPIDMKLIMWIIKKFFCQEIHLTVK